MNSSNDNTDGWGSCALRSTLNSTTYNSLSIKDKIKQVQKEYIKTYNSATSKTTSNDYLWLLSYREIWNVEYVGDSTGSLTITKEGSQYKYYKLGIPTGTPDSSFPKKPNSRNAEWWWLRSSCWRDGETFCLVSKWGSPRIYRC